ncbi:hypothetical protein L596_012909 [Steinernema carpocapsae]|uniref:FHA domain-containing protein n=1 Tax=Steinernema carpocapsae TaxID=34508 RepID=A0A4U5NYN3_STECR|nr:hypothetical protein L596_012909 [Steinernema carpocapsae]
MLSIGSAANPPLGSFVFENVGDCVTIGRDQKSCGIHVGAKAAGVSKQHIKLTLAMDFAGGPLLLVEEHNTYGTVFNGKKWKAPSIRAGDRFKVGSHEFYVKSLREEAEERDATPPPEEMLVEDDENEDFVDSQKKRNTTGPSQSAQSQVRPANSRRFASSLSQSRQQQRPVVCELDSDEEEPVLVKKPKRTDIRQFLSVDPISPAKHNARNGVDIRKFLGSSQSTLRADEARPGDRVLAQETVRESQMNQISSTPADTKRFFERRAARRKAEASQADLIPEEASPLTRKRSIADFSDDEPQDSHGVKKSAKDKKMKTNEGNAIRPESIMVKKAAERVSASLLAMVHSQKQVALDDFDPFEVEVESQPTEKCDSRRKDKMAAERTQKQESQKQVAVDDFDPFKVEVEPQPKEQCDTSGTGKMAAEGNQKQKSQKQVAVDNFDPFEIEMESKPVVPTPVVVRKVKKKPPTTEIADLKLEENQEVEERPKRPPPPLLKDFDGDEDDPVPNRCIITPPTPASRSNLTAVSTTSSSSSRNFKRFVKAPQGHFRNLSLEERTPMGTCTSLSTSCVERVFVVTL